MQLRAIMILLVMMSAARAQFTPALIQNESYWNDGKAEFSIYGAEIARYGIPRPTEVIHIVVREPFDPKQFVKTEDPKRAGTLPVLKMNQILTVPTGLYLYQQMHSNFWRVDNGQLLKFSLTSNDSCGNTYKEARRDESKFQYEYRTYWDGAAGGQESVAVPANGFFYDELPWLVRTIDFSNAGKTFEIQLTGSTINSKKDNFEFKPATFSFARADRFVDVTLKHAGGTDTFKLDAQFPHLLREWNAADGSKLKMKRNLKVDYWNYNKPGDRERALNNPMLRLPD